MGGRMPHETIIREQFAIAINEALNGLTPNEASYKTKVSDEWIRKMSHGRVPSESILAKMANGLGADLRALRVAAGYEQPTTIAETLKQQFTGRLPDDVLQNLVRYGATIDEQLKSDNLHGESEEKQ